jgi:hypothetical protein
MTVLGRCRGRQSSKLWPRFIAICPTSAAWFYTSQRKGDYHHYTATMIRDEFDGRYVRIVADNYRDHQRRAEINDDRVSRRRLECG